MIHYPYLIIGGGMTGVAAIRGIRKMDADGAIGMISNEAYPPYKRPFLSKALWQGVPYAKVWSEIDMKHVDLHLARYVIRIDREKKQVVDDQGTTYCFDKLLLATGVSARHLPLDEKGLIYFRGIDDYLKLKQQAEQKQHIAVIGGGFIGTEIASALVSNSNSVTMIFPEESIGIRTYPRALSHFLNRYYQSRGVNIVNNDTPVAITKEADGYKIRTHSNKFLNVDAVVAGVGTASNTDLAELSGLQIDNGIVVNELLQTSDPSIYAAGDVANFFNPALKIRTRVEHEDNANVMGEAAGVNMAGGSLPYDHLPFFYSDLFDLGYEAVGILDSTMEMVEDWQEGFRKGVVYYLEHKRVRGVLLWNTWGHIDEARALIADQGTFTPQSLTGRFT